jgi:hypothetical protein
MSGGLWHTGSKASKVDESREHSQAIEDAGVLHSVDERPRMLLTTTHGVALGELWEVSMPVGAMLLRNTAVLECCLHDSNSRVMNIVHEIGVIRHATEDGADFLGSVHDRSAGAGIEDERKEYQGR